MKAMIFAAGLGTRLRPLTDSCPKALVSVGGRPMLDRVIERLVACGVNEIVVNVHHHAGMVIDFLRQLDIPGVKFFVSDESDCLLDTGGGILNARRFLDGDEPFIVHNADILTDFDLGRMVSRHKESGVDATLLVSDRKTSRYLLFDSKELQMTGWMNISTGEVKPAGMVTDGMRALAFGGVHVLSPSIFNSLSGYSSVPKFSITSFYIDRCRDLDIRGYIPAEKYMWHDIGSIEKLKEAELKILSNNI